MARNNIDIDYNQRIISKDSRSLTYIFKNQEDFLNREGAAALAYFRGKQELKSKMIERYKNSFIPSVKIPDKTAQYLNYAEDSEFKILENGIDKAVQESFSKIISNIQSALGSGGSIGLSSAGGLDDVNKIDSILQGISEAAEFVFKGKNLNALSVAINSSRNKNGSYNLQKLNATLRRALEPPPDGTIVTGITDSSIISAIAALESLTFKLISKESLNVSSIENYIKNIFSAGFVEEIAANKVASKHVEAIQYVDNYLTNALGLTKLGGANSFENLKKSGYKPNVQTENFKLKVEEDSDSVTVNLGTFAETYSSYRSKSNFKTRVFSNKNFSQVLSAIFGDGKFFAYNTISNFTAGSGLYREMKQAIIMSFADKLLSGTGIGQDSSQYIVANGTFYPIYTILKTITQLDAENQDVLKITLSGESAAKSIREMYAGGPNDRLKAWHRTRKQIAVIDDLMVSGYFYPNNLLGRIII